MKNHHIIQLALGAVLLAATACREPAQEPVTDADEPFGEVNGSLGEPAPAPIEATPYATESLPPLPPVSNTERESYEQSARARLNDLRERAGELAERTSEVTAEAARDARARFEQEWPTLERRFDDLRTTTGEAWRDLQAELDGQIGRLGQSLQEWGEKLQDPATPVTPTESGHDLEPTTSSVTK